MSYSAAAAALALEVVCGELLTETSTTGTLPSSHSSPTTYSLRACNLVRVAISTMNAKTKAVEEKKGLCHHAGTPTPSKRQQNENFLKINKYFATEAAWRWVGDPMLVLKLSCDLDVTLSKRFVF